MDPCLVVGPVGGADFDSDEQQFERVVMAQDGFYLGKLLVWFQAEKTTPNMTVLASDLPPEKRIRYADLLGWPSDYRAWMRLIAFLLGRIDQIPVRLYPDIAEVFGVWQNALGLIRNTTSTAILRQCADWLVELDARMGKKDGDPAPRWVAVDDLKALRSVLESLVLRSSSVAPDLSEALLDRTLSLDKIRDDRFEELLPHFPMIAASYPALLVDLTLKYLKQELPDDRRARERGASERARRLREEALAKAPEDRTRQDNLAIQGQVSRRSFHGYSYHDWDSLFLDRGTRSFYPVSPLRDPFRSLFQTAPSEALRLLRELCNHAIAGWRQLHRHDPESGGEPVPLEMQFPWGAQSFWGSDTIYMWCRATRAPHPIGCGMMALERWCFSELDKGRDVDALIQQIVEGHDSIAILGVATMLASHTETISETVFALVSAQRLLNADAARYRSDFTSGFASLIGLDGAGHQADREAIVAANQRPVRQKQLSWLISRYFILAGDPYSDRMRDVVEAFEQDLPFQYAEHRNSPEARDHLGTLARGYAELVDDKNYKTYRTDDPGQLAVVHESPSAAEPAQIKKRERALAQLEEGNLWGWASQCFETGSLQDGFTIERAITLAEAIDTPGLFEPRDDHDLGQKRGAVAAVAAVLVRFRDGIDDTRLAWARDVLRRAAGAPEQRGDMWSPVSQIPWHHALFAIHGLTADFRAGTAEPDAHVTLLTLATHPLDMVSLNAIGAAFALVDFDPRLSLAAFNLGFASCDMGFRADRPMIGPDEPAHTDAVSATRVAEAIRLYRSDEPWTAPALPPPPWRRMQKADAARLRYVAVDDDEEPAEPAAGEQVWAESDHMFDWQLAAKLLPRIPVRAMLAHGRRAPFLAYVSGLLAWTTQSLAPPWLEKGDRDRDSNRMYEWTHGLGSFLGKLSGMLPAAAVADHLLGPITALKDESCWELLAPFADTLICASVYDAPLVPDDVLTILGLISDRFLAADELDPTAYRAGTFYGFDLPKLVKSLMFVSIDQDCPGAARYMNGDWSEIALILPIVDRYVRAAGWSSTVMALFLKLCERAREHYPTEAFADQILSIIEARADQLKGWRGSSVPARIAGLVQTLSDRDTPLSLPLAQKLLRILDLLIDMGDRRSAALQFGETFREVRLTG